MHTESTVVFVHSDAILFQNTTVCMVTALWYTFLLALLACKLLLLLSAAGRCGERKVKASKAMRAAEFGPAAEGKSTFASGNYRTYNTEWFRERGGNSMQKVGFKLYPSIHPSIPDHWSFKESCWTLPCLSLCSQQFDQSSTECGSPSCHHHAFAGSGPSQLWVQCHWWDPGTGSYEYWIWWNTWPVFHPCSTILLLRGATGRNVARWQLGKTIKDTVFDSFTVSPSTD